MDPSNADWKRCFEFFMSKEYLYIFLRGNFDLKEVPLNIPDYYYDSVKEWDLLKCTDDSEISHSYGTTKILKFTKRQSFVEISSMLGFGG